MSILNLKKNFIFIHIPKTAGTSMEHVDWIGESQDKHGSINEVYRFASLTLEITPDTMFKFAFVRNPYDRFMSGVVNHVLKSDNLERKAITAFIKGEENFNQYTVLREQNKFITSPVSGDILVDFIGRFEDLQSDFNKVCERLGEPQTDLPYKMISSHSNYDKFYTDETRAIVADYFSKDFEMFGYEK